MSTLRVYGFGNDHLQMPKATGLKYHVKKSTVLKPDSVELQPDVVEGGYGLELRFDLVVHIE